MKRFSFLLASLESVLKFRQRPRALSIDEIASIKEIKSTDKYSVIAEEQFNIGKAWYCEHQPSGSIYRISPEFGPPVQFVNSKKRAFIASLKAAAKWSSEHDSHAIKSNPDLVKGLSESLSKLDPRAFESADSQWPQLIEHIRINASDSDEEMEFIFEAG